MQEVLDRHYRRLADSYDEFLYYSPAFVRALTVRMIENLQLEPSDTLVDIGCGTGMYSTDILKQVPLQKPILGVDPYGEMLAQIPDDAAIEAIEEDALSFSRRKGSYNKVLMKETIHHVADVAEFFENVYSNLPVGGILLLVHVPPKVEYPLFEAALARCLTWHADPTTLSEQLAAAGFEVEHDTFGYRHVLPKEHYFNMVRSCYMSVLTSFSEVEMATGIEEMQDKYRHQSELKFVDHFDFLTATKAE